MKKRTLHLVQTFFLVLSSLGFSQETVDAYYEVIKREGEHPLQFVQQQLDTHDLILFDDALHNAVEPFEFYKDLLHAEENQIAYVFLEVFGINHQPQIDAYLESADKDDGLLLKVFQDDFSGYGWKYETYYELLSTIWDINRSSDKKIKVRAVDQPIYWEGIHTRKQYDIFLKSLVGRDYFMYKTILDMMASFKEGRKGIFLTNTRHAYKHIRNKEGALYWNTGTFFNQWHPDKTYSVRIHNATLSIERKKEADKNATSDGLGSYKYEWIQMQNGIWDHAFAENNNQPIAFSLKDNVFGRAAYVGNHMLNVEADQTMYDAYDALIFLNPLDQLHFSAKIDFIYTDAFKTELERRLRILQEGQMAEFLAKKEVGSLAEYIAQISVAQPRTKNDLIQLD